MACNTRPGVAPYLKFLEEVTGEKISQGDWHYLRQHVEDKTGKPMSRERVNVDTARAVASRLSGAIYLDQGVDYGHEDTISTYHESFDKMSESLDDGEVTVGTVAVLDFLAENGPSDILTEVREQRLFDEAYDKYAEPNPRTVKMNKKGVAGEAIAGAVSRRGLVTVEFVDLGEGLEGDYDPSDPDDIHLLRFDAYVKVTPSARFNEMNGVGEKPDSTNGWAARDNGSFCTQVPASASRETLRTLARQMANELEGTLGNGGWKGTAERLSWISDSDADQLAPIVD